MLEIVAWFKIRIVAKSQLIYTASSTNLIKKLNL